MSKQYYVGPAIKTLLVLNAAFPLVLLAGTLAGELSLWRWIESGADLTWGLVNGYFMYAAFSAPLLSISPETVRTRTWLDRTGRQIERAAIDGLAWSNSETVCVRLKSGQLEPIGLRGLGRASKEQARVELQSWLRTASNIA